MSQFINFSGGVVPPPGIAVVSLTPDSGTSPVVPDGAGNINVLGGSNINTVGSLNTLTINLDNDIFIHDETLTDLTASSAPSDINFIKRRGAGIITTGDGLGNLFYYGYDGSSDILSAAMSVESTGTIGVSRIPSQFEWYTTPDTIAPALTLRMGIPDSGGLVIQNPTSGIGLAVLGGGANITGTVGLLSYGLGVIQASAGGVLSSTNGTDGQILIANSDGVTAPTWANITSTSGTITVTNGPNSINLEATSMFLMITNLVGAGGSYVVLNTDQYLSCDVSLNTLTIQLPNSTTEGRIIRIKDYTGDCSTNNITITTVGGAVNIDGATSYVMNSDFQSVSLIWNNTNSAYEIF